MFASTISAPYNSLGRHKKLAVIDCKKIELCDSSNCAFVCLLPLSSAFHSSGRCFNQPIRRRDLEHLPLFVDHGNDLLDKGDQCRLLIILVGTPTWRKAHPENVVGTCGSWSKMLNTASPCASDIQPG